MIFAVDNDKCVEFCISFIDINHVLLDFEFINIIIGTRERIEPGFSGSSSVWFSFTFVKLFRVRFGSVLFHFLKHVSSSVRFGFIFQKSVWVRFGFENVVRVGFDSSSIISTLGSDWTSISSNTYNFEKSFILSYFNCFSSFTYILSKCRTI